MPKFKFGDRLICKRGYQSTDDGEDYAGAGYKEGRTIVVKSIDSASKGCIYWPVGSGNGIYEQALEYEKRKEAKLFKEMFIVLDAEGRVASSELYDTFDLAAKALDTRFTDMIIAKVIPISIATINEEIVIK